MPGDDPDAGGGQQIDEMTAGKTCGASDENRVRHARTAGYRGTPLSAPLNGEKLPRPASVKERKKRWSEGIGDAPTP